MSGNRVDMMLNEPPLGRSITELIQTLEAKRQGTCWFARCPAHDDHTPSLAISESDEGQVLVHCHAGCSQDMVVDALRRMGAWPGCKAAGLTPAPRSSGRKAYPSWEAATEAVAALVGGKLAGRWIYQRADGTEAFRVARFNKPDGNKEFRPLHDTGNGWAVGDPSGPLPLYRLTDLKEASRVYVVEGEKCADVARVIGLTATTSAHGANAASRTDWQPLAGKEVVLLPDNDPAGRQYADRVAQIMSRLDPPASVKTVVVPGLPEGGDLADYIELRDSTDGEDLRRYLEYLADNADTLANRENTIRAPIERGLARNEFDLPVPASALGSALDVQWVWGGFLAQGFITLLTGLWKAGKTTLEAHLIQAMGEGGELGRPVTAGRVLVVAEEGQALWARRRDELGIGDHAEFDIRPFLGRPSQQMWGAYVFHLAQTVRGRGYRLVIIDTLASMSPVSDENDAARMLAVLTPLRAITEAGAAILLAHHPRKGDAGEGQASRGSGALPGYVDIILELRRFDAKNRDDTRRVLTAFSRFDETPRELVLELTPDGYVCHGNRTDAKQQDRLKVIATLLPTAPPGLTVDEVREKWPTEGRPPSERALGKDLKLAAASELWVVTGSGRKGSPYRYQVHENSIRAHPLSIGARNESASPQDATPEDARP